MKTLEKNIKNMLGEDGKKWLDSLPNLVEKLSHYWSLTHIKPVKNMNWNFVALAIQKNTDLVVLKISFDKQLIQNEYKTLKHFNGHGAIKVLDINKDDHALLLEQAVPGRLLKEFYPSQINETLHIYGQLVKVLSKTKLAHKSYTHVSQWCKAIDGITDQRIDTRYVIKAKELKSALLNSAQYEYLCHGDLHLENILQQGSHWLAIDPKGIIGEMAFEAAAFDLISQEEMQDTSTITTKIIDRVTTLSTVLGLDFHRLLSWIFLRMIISAQWFVEDHGDTGDMLNRAAYIYPLLGYFSFIERH